MTLQSSPSTSAGQLLSPANQVVCTRLSSSNTPDVCQRAAALILLDQGSTQAETSEKSGLSIGQIRYLVRRFKEKGMELFPAEVLADVADNQPAGQEQPAATTEAAPDPAETAVNNDQDQETEGAPEKSAAQKTGHGRKKTSKKRPKRPKPIKKKKQG